jgi:membrane-associated phospholipid phosphatase
MVSATSDRRPTVTVAPIGRGAPAFPRGVRATAVELLTAYVVLTGVWVALGFLLTGPMAGTGLVELDNDIATWMVDQRTPALDDWSNVGNLLADTLVKVIATAVIAAVMLAIWRSWREPLLVALALVLEASVFITTTWIVGRPRPDVPRLDSSPVGSSFPSGHVAAATAYTAVAIVIFERTRNAWIRGVTVAVMIVVPLAVGLARMYRGMHYLTDIVAGVALGAASVIVVYVIFRPPSPSEAAAARR